MLFATVGGPSVYAALNEFSENFPLKYKHLVSIHLFAFGTVLVKRRYVQSFDEVVPEYLRKLLVRVQRTPSHAANPI